MITRRRLLAVVGGLPLTVVLGCGAGAGAGTTLERAQRAGAIRVGIAGEQPYGYADPDGRITGAQPEVARAALASIGIDGLEAVQVAFDQLIPGLRSEQYDMICAGMTVTPPRCAQVAFSRPDFVAPPAFLVRSGNPRRITTFGGVARSVVLGVLAGSAERDYAVAAGVPTDRLHEYGSQSALFRAVAERDVPVAVLTAISLADVLRRNPGADVEITDPVVPTVDGRDVVPARAFVMRPADADLRARFDEALARCSAPASGSGSPSRSASPRPICRPPRSPPSPSARTLARSRNPGAPIDPLGGGRRGGMWTSDEARRAGRRGGLERDLVQPDRVDCGEPDLVVRSAPAAFTIRGHRGAPADLALPGPPPRPILRPRAHDGRSARGRGIPATRAPISPLVPVRAQTSGKW